jgi:hypothetical protein
MAWKFAQLERFGFPILLLLLFTGILGSLSDALLPDCQVLFNYLPEPFLVSDRSCTQNESSPACAPPGSLHLGHYHGVLKNWVKLQHEYPCLFFVADWHALTTQYDDPQASKATSWDMVIDWLAAGVDPAQATCSSSRRCPSTPNCTCCCR